MESRLTEKNFCGAFDGCLCIDAGDGLVEKVERPDTGKFLQMLLDWGVIGPPDEDE